ncbi:hypothetical protein [Corynebacterium bouchesdurhonense]|uniref:hypothetical protein n=1 Tax=Corynebacterium bouchesdurhonense TaxID=1720192 RepID=UPI0012B67C2F|nr:hypothetical protein [Corynebacterium bouchesdurhonense]
MAAPKPHDPRAPHVGVDTLREEFNGLLGEHAETLSDEVALLTRAHALLHDALQAG